MSPKRDKALLGMLLTLVLAITNSGCGGGQAAAPAISVSVSPPSASVATSASQQVTATVNNDRSNAGVTWTLTQNGTPCSPSCGSIAPSSTASGAPVSYTAPATVPNSAMVTLTATSAADMTKAGSSTITVTARIAVSVSPPSATAPSGGTQPFIATVINDPSNGGVSWQVMAKLWCNGIATGHPNCNGGPPWVVVPCSTCGTVSPPSTTTGAATTYTAPAHLAPPGKAGYFFGNVQLVATSATNSSASGSAGIKVLPISVSLSPTSANVALSATQQFTAAVTNDATNSGVTWSLTQNGVVCSPGCGTINPTSTASGAAATYTAPATSPTVPIVTVTAASVEDTTNSGSSAAILTTSSGGLPCSAGSGEESLLKGQYALLLQFFASQGDLVIAGSITADGTGKITAGEQDIVWAMGGGQVPPTINGTASLYAVGPDHRGCLLLAGTNGETTFLSFALGSINSTSIASKGYVTGLNETTGVPTRVGTTRVAGTIRLQDPASFTASQLKGNYAFGVLGRTPKIPGTAVTGSTAMAGTFAADGTSAITSSNFDINAGGALNSDLSSTGSFTCCDSNGRGTLQLSTPTNPPINNFVVYMIGSGNAFLLVNSDTWGAGGEAVAIASGTTFTQASLDGASVLRETAQSSSGPVADLATVAADGKGALTINDNVNNAGTFTSSSTALNFTVTSNGRVAFTGGSTPPVVYLYSANQGFLVGTDADVTFGILEPQTAGPFSDTSFSGAYMFGTENPSASTLTLESGVVTADGKGNATGTVDQSNSTGLTQNQSLNFTYSFPANGLGNIGSGTTAILISGNKLVFINNTSANPTIIVVEK